jgi:hypothetical protein
MVDYVRLLASHYGMKEEDIEQCIAGVQKEIKGVDAKAIYDSVMDAIGVQEYLPRDALFQLSMFLPLDKFLLLCQVDVRHAQLCETSGYWLAYLYNKDKKDWARVIKLILTKDLPAKVLREVVAGYLKVHPQRPVNVLLDVMDTYSLDTLRTMLKEYLLIHFSQPKYVAYGKEILDAKTLKQIHHTPFRPILYNMQDRWNDFISSIVRLIKNLPETEDLSQFETNIFVHKYYFMLPYISWAGRYLLQTKDMGEEYSLVLEEIEDVIVDSIQVVTMTGIDFSFTDMVVAHYFTSWKEAIEVYRMVLDLDGAHLINNTYSIINPLLLRDMLFRMPTLLQDPDLEDDAKKVIKSMLRI